MAQIDRLLAPGERVHLISREHGVVLLRPFVRAAAALGVLAVGAVAVAGLDVPAAVRVVPLALAGGAAALVLLRLTRDVARWQQRILVVTDRRAVLVAGALAQRAEVMPLAAISDIEIVCPAAGRVLHYGGVVVAAGGRRGLLLGMRRLPDPDLLLGLLLGLAEEAAHARPRWAPAAPGALR